jgi:hypothetical protein
MGALPPQRLLALLAGLLTAATSSGCGDGTITANAREEFTAVQSHGFTFQSSNVLPVFSRTYTVTVQDANGVSALILLMSPLFFLFHYSTLMLLVKERCENLRWSAVRNKQRLFYR